MSNIQKFIEKYPTPINELDKKLKEINDMDISNIKKLDLIEEAKEEFRFKLEGSGNTSSSLFKDSFYDQMIIGYGIYD